jgi:hypothetical protein
VEVLEPKAADLSWPNRSGGRSGRQPSHALQVLDHGYQVERVPCARQSSQAHAFKPQSGLEMGKQHLDLLPLVARGRELQHSGKLSSLIASRFMHAAQQRESTAP